MRRAGRFGFGCLAWAVASIATAQVDVRDSESLAGRAHVAYEQGQLRPALALFEQALEAGGQSPAELANIYLYLGLLHGVGGDTSRTRVAFEAALALDPSIERPAEIGPRLGSVFDEARHARAGLHLRLTVAITSPETGAGPELRAEALDAPEGLIRRLRVLRIMQGGTELLHEAEYAGAISWSVPAAAREGNNPLDLTVEAVNEFGGTLVAETVSVPAAVVPSIPLPAPRRPNPLSDPPSAPAPESRRGASVVASPWLWIGVGAVAAAGALTGWWLTSREDRYFVGPPAFVEP